MIRAVGFVAFGEVNTPRSLIDQKSQLARAALEATGLEIVDAGVVTDEPTGSQAQRAQSVLSRHEFDLLVVCVVGWIPSQPVIDVADAFRDHAMVLWGLSGSTVDGRLVSTADQAGTTALRQPMAQLGYRFTYVYDRPDRAGESAHRIANLAQAATAAHRLRATRVGTMGYRDMNLFSTLLDTIALRREIGAEVETFELLEVVQAMASVQNERVNEVIDWIHGHWVFDRPIGTGDSTLDTGARMYLAVHDKALERHFDAISLIDGAGTKKLLQFPPGIVLALLADLGSFASIPENDIAGAVTQLIIRYLTGQVGAYFEFYEFFEDRLLVGVPDFVPAEVVEGDVHVVPWPGFGGLQGGLLNVSQVKTGPITICRLGADNNRFQLHVAYGTAHAPRRWEEAGWDPPAPQLPSLEIELEDSNVEAFAGKVLGQHYIVAYGDHREALHALCRLLGVSVT